MEVGRKKKHFALVFVNTQFFQKLFLPSLVLGEKKVKQYKDLFKNLGYTDDNVIVISDVEGENGLAKHLEAPKDLLFYLSSDELKLKVSGGTIMVYFVTHGLRLIGPNASEPGLCLKQTKKNMNTNRWENVLPVSEMGMALRNTGAESVVLVLEACHGGFDSDGGWKEEVDGFVQPTNPPSFLCRPAPKDSIKGFYVLTSTSPDQAGREGSHFTEFVTECLRGKGGRQVNENGYVTASLFVRQICYEMPTPPTTTAWRMEGSLDFVLSPNPVAIPPVTESKVKRLTNTIVKEWEDDITSLLNVIETKVKGYYTEYEKIPGSNAIVGAVLSKMSKFETAVRAEKNGIINGNIDYGTPYLISNSRHQWELLLNDLSTKNVSVISSNMAKGHREIVTKLTSQLKMDMVELKAEFRDIMKEMTEGDVSHATGRQNLQDSYTDDLPRIIDHVTTKVLPGDIVKYTVNASLILKKDDKVGAFKRNALPCEVSDLLNHIVVVMARYVCYGETKEHRLCFADFCRDLRDSLNRCLWNISFTYGIASRALGWIKGELPYLEVALSLKRTAQCLRPCIEQILDSTEVKRTDCRKYLTSFLSDYPMPTTMIESGGQSADPVRISVSISGENLSERVLVPLFDEYLEKWPLHVTELTMEDQCMNMIICAPCSPEVDDVPNTEEGCKVAEERITRVFKKNSKISIDKLTAVAEDMHIDFSCSWIVEVTTEDVLRTIEKLTQIVYRDKKTAMIYLCRAFDDDNLWFAWYRGPWLDFSKTSMAFAESIIIEIVAVRFAFPVCSVSEAKVEVLRCQVLAARLADDEEKVKELFSTHPYLSEDRFASLCSKLGPGALDSVTSLQRFIESHRLPESLKDLSTSVNIQEKAKTQIGHIDTVESEANFKDRVKELETDTKPVDAIELARVTQLNDLVPLARVACDLVPGARLCEIIAEAAPVPQLTSPFENAITEGVKLEIDSSRLLRFIADEDTASRIYSNDTTVQYQWFRKQQSSDTYDELIAGNNDCYASSLFEAGYSFVVRVTVMKKGTKRENLEIFAVEAKTPGPLEIQKVADTADDYRFDTFVVDSKGLYNPPTLHQLVRLHISNDFVAVSSDTVHCWVPTIAVQMVYEISSVHFKLRWRRLGAEPVPVNTDWFEITLATAGYNMRETVAMVLERSKQKYCDAKSPGTQRFDFGILWAEPEPEPVQRGFHNLNTGILLQIYQKDIQNELLDFLSKEFVPPSSTTITSRNSTGEIIDAVAEKAVSNFANSFNETVNLLVNISSYTIEHYWFYVLLSFFKRDVCLKYPLIYENGVLTDKRPSTPSQKYSELEDAALLFCHENSSLPTKKFQVSLTAKQNCVGASISINLCGSKEKCECGEKNGDDDRYKMALTCPRCGVEGYCYSQEPTDISLPAGLPDKTIVVVMNALPPNHVHPVNMILRVNVNPLKSSGCTVLGKDLYFTVFVSDFTKEIMLDHPCGEKIPIQFQDDQQHYFEGLGMPYYDEETRTTQWGTANILPVRKLEFLSKDSYSNNAYNELEMIAKNTLKTVIECPEPHQFEPVPFVRATIRSIAQLPHLFEVLTSAMRAVVLQVAATILSPTCESDSSHLVRESESLGMEEFAAITQMLSAKTKEILQWAMSKFSRDFEELTPDWLVQEVPELASTIISQSIELVLHSSHFGVRDFITLITRLISIPAAVLPRALLSMQLKFTVYESVKTVYESVKNYKFFLNSFSESVLQVSTAISNISYELTGLHIFNSDRLLIFIKSKNTVTTLLLLASYFIDAVEDPEYTLEDANIALKRFIKGIIHFLLSCLLDIIGYQRVHILERKFDDNTESLVCAVLHRLMAELNSLGYDLHNSVVLDEIGEKVQAGFSVFQEKLTKNWAILTKLGKTSVLNVLCAIPGMPKYSDVSAFIMNSGESWSALANVLEFAVQRTLNFIRDIDSEYRVATHADTEVPRVFSRLTALFDEISKYACLMIPLLRHFQMKKDRLETIANELDYERNYCARSLTNHGLQKQNLGDILSAIQNLRQAKNVAFKNNYYNSGELESILLKREVSVHIGFASSTHDQKADHVQSLIDLDSAILQLSEENAKEDELARTHMSRAVVFDALGYKYSSKSDLECAMALSSNYVPAVHMYEELVKQNQEPLPGESITHLIDFALYMTEFGLQAIIETADRIRDAGKLRHASIAYAVCAEAAERESHTKIKNESLKSRAVIHLQLRESYLAVGCAKAVLDNIPTDYYCISCMKRALSLTGKPMEKSDHGMQPGPIPHDWKEVFTSHTAHRGNVVSENMDIVDQYFDEHAKKLLDSAKRARRSKDSAIVAAIWGKVGCGRDRLASKLASLIDPEIEPQRPKIRKCRDDAEFQTCFNDIIMMYRYGSIIILEDVPETHRSILARLLTRVSPTLHVIAICLGTPIITEGVAGYEMPDVSLELRKKYIRKCLEFHPVSQQVETATEQIAAAVGPSICVLLDVGQLFGANRWRIPKYFERNVEDVLSILRGDNVQDSIRELPGTRSSLILGISDLPPNALQLLHCLTVFPSSFDPDVLKVIWSNALRLEGKIQVRDEIETRGSLDILIAAGLVETSTHQGIYKFTLSKIVRPICLQVNAENRIQLWKKAMMAHFLLYLEDLARTWIENPNEQDACQVYLEQFRPYINLIAEWSQDYVSSVNALNQPVSSLRVFIDAHIAVIEKDYTMLCSCLEHFTNRWNKMVPQAILEQFENGGEKMLNSAFQGSELNKLFAASYRKKPYSMAKLKPLFIAQALMAYTKFNGNLSDVKQAVLLLRQPRATTSFFASTSMPTMDLVAKDVQYVIGLPSREEKNENEAGLKLLKASAMYLASLNSNIFKANPLHTARVLHNCAVTFYASRADNASANYLSLSQHFLKKIDIEPDESWDRESLFKKLQTSARLLETHYPFDNVFPILQPRSLTSMPGLMESVSVMGKIGHVDEVIVDVDEGRKSISVLSSTKYLPLTLLRSFLLISLFFAKYSKIFGVTLNALLVMCIAFMLGASWFGELGLILVIQLVGCGIIAFSLVWLNNLLGRIGIAKVLAHAVNVSGGISLLFLSLQSPSIWHFAIYLGFVILLALFMAFVIRLSRVYLNPFSENQRKRQFARNVLLFATMPISVLQQVIFRWTLGHDAARQNISSIFSGKTPNMELHDGDQRPENIGAGVGSITEGQPVATESELSVGLRRRDVG